MSTSHKRNTSSIGLTPDQWKRSKIDEVQLPTGSSVLIPQGSWCQDLDNYENGTPKTLIERLNLLMKSLQSRYEELEATRNRLEKRHGIEIDQCDDELLDRLIVLDNEYKQYEDRRGWFQFWGHQAEQALCSAADASFPK